MIADPERISISTYRKYGTTFVASLLDLVDFVDGNLREALDDPASQLAAATEAGCAMPVILERLREDQAIGLPAQSHGAKPATSAQYGKIAHRATNLGITILGTSTDAHCFACGYDTFLRLGGGMTNHTTYAAWPVSCKVCSAITTANFKQSPLVCNQCKSSDATPITDRSEWQGDGKVITTWGKLTLTDGHHRCPKCAAFELRFGTNVGETQL